MSAFERMLKKYRVSHCIVADFYFLKMEFLFLCIYTI